MVADRRRLLVVAAWAAGSFAAVAFSDSVGLRSIICLPLALYGIGFAVTGAIRPRVGSATEGHILAVAASLVSLVAGGFVLNAGGWLGLQGWAVWTTGVTFAGCFVAAMRPTEPASVGAGGLRRIGAAAVVGSCAAILLISGAFAIALHDERNWREFPATEFWMVPDRVSAPGSIGIGLRNAEQGRMRYEIEVVADGMLVSGWRDIDLEPGESFVRRMPVDGRFRRLEARLFRRDQPDRIYRKVWIDRRDGVP